MTDQQRQFAAEHHSPAGKGLAGQRVLRYCRVRVPSGCVPISYRSGPGEVFFHHHRVEGHGPEHQLLPPHRDTAEGC